MSNDLYNKLKFVAQVLLPALTTLIVTLNSLWNWGLPIEAIAGTLTAIDTFLGAILHISTVKYIEKEDKIDG